jgi:hypothetical protein
MNDDSPKPITRAFPREIEGGVEPASVIRVPPPPPKKSESGTQPSRPIESRKK